MATKPNSTAIADAIESFVRDRYDIDPDDRFFRRDIDLAGRGYLDSIGVVETLAFIDTTFGRRIEPAELIALGAFQIDRLAEVASTAAAAPPPTLDLVVTPDRNAVADLMVRAWPEPCWYYRTELLDGYLDRPTAATGALHLAIYRGQHLLASSAAIPYRIRCGDATLTVLQGAFWVADPNFVGCGAGPAILAETLRRARAEAEAHDHAGFLALVESDSHAARLLGVMEGARGLRRIDTSRPWINTPEGILCQPAQPTDAPSEDPLTVQHYSSADRADCAKLFAATDDDPSLELSKVVPDEDVDYVLAQRHGTTTWVASRDGEVLALLNVLCAEAQQHTGDRVTALLENLLLQRLSATERQQFLRAVFRDPYWADVELLAAQVHGELAEDLRQIGFFPGSQEYSLYLLPFDDRLALTSDSTANGDSHCRVDLL